MSKILNATELTQKNMYDYGISVIEDRALPDLKDGLKPIKSLQKFLALYLVS